MTSLYSCDTNEKIEEAHRIYFYRTNSLSIRDQSKNMPQEILDLYMNLDYDSLSKKL